MFKVPHNTRMPRICVGPVNDVHDRVHMHVAGAIYQFTLQFSTSAGEYFETGKLNHRVSKLSKSLCWSLTANITSTPIQAVIVMVCHFIYTVAAVCTRKDHIFISNKIQLQNTVIMIMWWRPCSYCTTGRNPWFLMTHADTCSVTMLRCACWHYNLQFMAGPFSQRIFFNGGTRYMITVAWTMLCARSRVLLIWHTSLDNTQCYNHAVIYVIQGMGGR